MGISLLLEEEADAGYPDGTGGEAGGGVGWGDAAEGYYFFWRYGCGLGQEFQAGSLLTVFFEDWGEEDQVGFFGLCVADFFEGVGGDAYQRAWAVEFFVEGSDLGWGEFAG